jgi:hypothetical protein
MGRYNDLIDRMDGYTIGTLIIEGGTVSLQRDNANCVPLDSAKSLEILAGDKYHAVTVDECLTEVDEAGWPMFAGFYARVSF